MDVAERERLATYLDENPTVAERLAIILADPDQREQFRQRVLASYRARKARERAEKITAYPWQ
jgi:hypothetical protein